MNNEDFIVKNGKAMRIGYTTGSCAAAAATAAARMLVTGQTVYSASIWLPGGKVVNFDINDVVISEAAASCSVIKDAGDDPDVTHGMKIFAECVFCESGGVEVTGGDGVGIVKGHGLSVSPGQYAINPVPKRMITENVARVLAQKDIERGVCVAISAPGGAEIAKKTFNARLGIEGGISILGTTGIVEPMSEKAIVDTIKLMIDRYKLDSPENILISPGNYGRDYCASVLGVDIGKAVKYSNFLGETLDYIVYKRFKRVLLVGHAGKLSKVAGGVMNTHSSIADCRMEVIAAHAACAGADTELVKKIMGCQTTDHAIMQLDQNDLTAPVFTSIMDKIMFHLKYRVKEDLDIETILFSGKSYLTVKSGGADEFIKLFTEE